MGMVYINPAPVGRGIPTTSEPQRFSIALFSVKSPRLITKRWFAHMYI